MRIKKPPLKKILSTVIIFCLIIQTFALLNPSVSAESADIRMRYYAGGSWQDFNNGMASANDIGAIKLQSKSSNYYLQYRTQNANVAGYYSYMKSNVDDFAGTTSGKTIQLLQIGAYTTAGEKITSGIVVMYRVMVGGAWLSWVSNADPEWMLSVKTKYNLSGNLDTHGSYAGSTGNNIQAVEIHVYEEDNINTSSGSFSGMESDDGFTYLANNTSTWSQKTKSAMCGMDCIKIQTGSSKKYYLKYQTMNEGASSFYSEVSSRDSNSFAGVSGKPIQLLRIRVYTEDNVKLSSGIVVMYRTRVGTEWLPWVSNADPEYMISVQSQYNLGGTLDTHSSYAGKSGTNITGVQIQIFEGEIPSTTVSGMSGQEYTPATMQYMANSLNNWTNFSDNNAQASSIGGLKIHTPSSKDYYLGYNVYGANKGGYYGEVKSNENTCAGKESAYDPIQRLSIRVYNSSGVSMQTGVVVMYRAKVDTGWLPWVSNADPSWMQSALMKYHLEGTLDTSSGYAGATGKNIIGIQIHIYEETGLTTVTSPTGNYKIIQTPLIYQYDRSSYYPTGCESASTVMALRYSGVNISMPTFVNNYLDKCPSTTDFDPNECFGGNPKYSSGMGCYAPVIMKACNKLLAGKRQYATRVYADTLAQLCSTYIDNNIPVIVWATSGMRACYSGRPLGEDRVWIAPEHCLLLVGYDQYNYIFKDPMVNRYVTYYGKTQCEAAFNGLGKQAIVIRNGSAPSTTPSVPSTPTAHPTSAPTEEVKTSPVSESHCADPVDLSTGSHVITNDLISLFGGNSLTVSASYNSSQLVEGSMGIGWSFNYEKSMSVTENEIRIYNTPSVYNRYVSGTSTNTYACSTKGKNGYMLTVQADGSYLLNCNNNGTELYNSAGKLVSVTDHQGFVTTIGYSDSLITLTDVLTGKHIYLEKNADGNIVRIYDDDSREVILTYSNNYLTLIKDVSGNYLTYTYNATGKIETGTDGEGVCYFKNEYDASGRVIKQYDGIYDEDTGENHFTLFSYGENNNITVTDRNNNTSTRVFNNDGQLTSYTDENGNTTVYTYDSNLNLITTTDALGHTEAAVYNAVNLPIEQTDKNGIKTKMAYDSNGNLISVLYNEKGDINNDMTVDIRDLVRVKRYFADDSTPVNLNAADINSDNNYNGADLVALRKYLIGADNLYISCKSFSYNERNQVISASDLRGTVTAYTYDATGMPLSQTSGSRSVSYAYLNGLLMSQTDARNNTTSYTYNSLGQMQTSTDAAGSTTTYAYDNKGNLLQLTNAANGSIFYTYDGNGLKTSYTDANGNKTFYGYNGNMKLETITMPSSTNITYSYDGEDRLISTINQNGAEAATVYDAAGRIVRKSDEEKNTTYYEYDAVGNIIKQINPNGSTVTNTYDAKGNLLTTADAVGNVTEYQYNAFSKPTKTINAQNGITQSIYLASGELLSVTDPIGNITKYMYDQYGNKTSDTDANGNKTVYSYDGNNNLVSVKDALGNITTRVYDFNNRLLSVTDANNHTVTYGYDVLGRQTTITDAKGNTTTKTYDANGNVLTVADAKGNVQTEASYDENNRAISVTDASGNTTANKYDKTGNLLSSTDALGGSQSYTYSASGKMTAATNQDGKTSTAIYNASGSITSLSGTLGGATNYTYDAANRLVSESTTSGGTVSYTYNALNLKESLTNARNQSATYTYDLAGRITGYTAPEGTAAYTYDANGNVLTATDQSGTITREYDALNRVTKYTDVNGRTIQYCYDAVGNLSKLIYPDNTSVYYFYDSCNNLIQAKWWDNIELGDDELPPQIPGLLIPIDWFDSKSIFYTYDQNNNILSISKPDSSVTTNIYDDAQRIVSTVERKADNTIIVGYEYSYDALGRVVSETDLAANKRSDYTYDNLSRVLTKTVTDLSTNEASAENFTYDDAGNISSCTVSDGANTFVYDTNNRLTSFNGQAVSYDADGNMLNADGMTYTYDSANRLISAGGNTYTYDVENVRVRNLCADSDTSYTYNTNAKMSQLLWVQQSDGTVTKYVYAIGLVGEETNGNFKTYHYDYRGSTTAITDKDGNITDTFTYDTYGKVISRTGTTDTPFLYNGRDGVMTDSNGLFYMRARYYNPTLKRFVNADIIVGELSNSATLNRYAYANGNPVSNVDPFGLSADERGETISKKDYINNYMENTENPVYILLKSLGIDFCQEISNQEIPMLEMFFGGLKVNMYVSISYQTNLDGDISITHSSSDKFDIETVVGLFTNGSLRFSLGSYTDSERLSLGNSISAKSSEWDFSIKKQVGLYSEASILGFGYTPDDIILPSVSIAIDSEMNHLIKIGTAVIAATAASIPSSIAAIPAAISNMSASSSAAFASFASAVLTNLLSATAQ